MPSSAGRYRSRLLNFLSRQSRRLVDKGDLALRHIRVGATWAAQILLYPVYLAFQAGRLAGRQLQQTLQQNNSASPNLPLSDTPIQRVLETVKGEAFLNISLGSTKKLSSECFDPTIPVDLSANEVAADGNMEQDLAIQGIAMRLETRTLVVVTADNEILDILTPQQQQEIFKQIRFEIPSYLHDQLVARNAKTKVINQLSLLDDRPNLLAPIRLFRKLMTWVQTGPVATLVNLFQEETLLVNLETRTQQLKLKGQELKLKSQELQLKIEESAIASAKYPENEAIDQENNENVEVKSTPVQESAEMAVPSFISSLDRRIAELEAGNLAVVTEVTASVAHRSQEFLQLVKTRLIDSHLTVSDVPNVDIDDFQARQFKIQALIKAAVDYFFGADRAVKLPDQTTLTLTSSEEQTVTPPIIGSSEEQSRKRFPFNWPKLLSHRGLETQTIGPDSQNKKTSEEPWLTPNDLFGDSLSNTSQNLRQLPGKKSSATPASIAPSKQTVVAAGNNIPNRINRDRKPKQAIVRQPESHPSESAQKKGRKSENNSNSDPIVRSNNTRTVNSNTSHSKSKLSQQQNAVKSASTSARKKRADRITDEMAVQAAKTARGGRESYDNSESDWIEIKAKPAGYVKHPLEHILELLDMAMLWLEEIIVKVWNSLLGNLTRRK
ncbi:hypothetical protein [Argonema galeatum]|uniref:hypothetical protein n=1 Tax=Argonema galeatum TaxID=2942762 RepID=UPI002013452E|nr:hypothetical protein [Argonema galeatum]MCL1466906.1 hypothetical protein [Argonema galeatum A003/A1]